MCKQDSSLQTLLKICSENDVKTDESYKKKKNLIRILIPNLIFFIASKL